MAARTISETPDEQVDRVFDAIRHHRRRRTLRILEAEGGEATLREIAERVADVEYDDPDEADIKRVYVGLYQSHMPRLADAGYVVWAQGEGSVWLTEDAVVPLRYLDFDATAGPIGRLRSAVR